MRITGVSGMAHNRSEAVQGHRLESRSKFIGLVNLSIKACAF